MSRLGKALIILVSWLTIAAPAVAHADKICVLKKVRVKRNIQFARAVIREPRECPANSTEILDTGDFAAADHPSTDNKLIGFAKFTGSGMLLSFGGRGTTSVNISRVFDGVYDLTFAGTFPDLAIADVSANREALTALVTAQALGFHVVSAGISSANAVEIVVRVATWRSTSLVPVDASAGIALLLGQTP